MKHFGFSCFFIFMAILSLFAPALSGAGYVPVRNFDRRSYAGGPQNWGAVQDSIGRMYIGNRDGMIQFDGVRWQTHYLSNYTTARSLRYDRKSGRIYVGGSEEFGFFSPDPATGQLKYHSLIAMLGPKAPNFTEIWNILEYDGALWFQSDYILFRYDGGTMSSFPAGARISRSAVIDSRLLLGMDDGSILRFNGARFEPLPGTAANSGRKVSGILPGTSPGSLIIATSFDGLYSYADGILSPLVTDIDSFLKENQIFSTAVRGDSYVFGTVNGGAVVKNFRNGTTRYINKDGGMQNNTVLAIAFDRDGNIWLCLDNGVDYALLNSPVSTLIGTSNAIGAGYASLRSGPRMFFGTNQGLYSSAYPFEASPDPLPLSRILRGQIWSITESSPGIFAAGDAGLFWSDGSSDFRPVEGIQGAYMALPLPGNAGYALASTYDRFHLLGRTPGGWTDLGAVGGYDDIGGSFQFDRHGYIWFTHFRKGIYRLSLDAAGRRFDEAKLYTREDGLPGAHDNSVAIINGEAVFSTDNGFFRLERQSGRLVPDKKLNDALQTRSRCKLYQLPDGIIMVLNNSGMEFGRIRNDGSIAMDPSSPVGGGGLLIPGSESATFLSPNSLVVSNQEGFWNIDPGERLTAPPHVPFINAIHANRDSLVYAAATDRVTPSRLEFDHSLNSLRFDFAFPDYRNNGNIEFSSFLENYDEDWTPFSAETSREYTRLADGDYVFRLRARDPVTGHVSESSLSFRITPPWHRTAIARITYVVLALALAFFAFLWARRWLRRAQQRLVLRKEKELQELRLESEREALKKDYEIASLKSEQLEHDVRHKSNELSNTTMNLIRKNEILNDIAEHINRIRQQLKDDDAAPQAQKQLSRILNAIRDNISHDDDWKNFTRNFDIVYENFTRRLMELHPNLTAADQRLCCYIRMRLSSKEIAPLINISYKSVEMARYRLRKKMDLAPDVSLTDYLATLTE